MQEVSVVIPNFNGMAYLDGVLSSLERQTIRNFEVMVPQMAAVHLFQRNIHGYT